MKSIVYGFLAFGFAGCSSICCAYAKEEPATVIPASREGEKEYATIHKEINERAKAGDVDLIFIGDSITSNWGNRAAWQKYYSGRKAMNAAIGGDRTQHLLWRLDNGNIDGISPKLAVVMIGTNNSGSDTPEDILAGIKAIIGRLRTKLPQTKILLLGIFPRGATASDANRRVTIKVNELMKDVADGKYVFYLDIGEKFLQPDGSISSDVMPDFVHLSDKGYEIWAQAIEPKVSELLGDTPKQ